MFTYPGLRTKIRFETEANGNSEMGSELHASPHIHIWLRRSIYGYIWIRQYGSGLYMWASVKFLPGNGPLILYLYNPIIHLLYVRPEICIGIVSDFSWDIFMSQEKLQTMIMKKFGCKRGVLKDLCK